MAAEETGASGDEALASAFAALGSPARLALLRHLQDARALGEIELKARAPSAGSSGRNLTRQTVRTHLDRLLRIGAVVPQPTERGRAQGVAYQLNHQALFALAEELRALARVRPSAEPRVPTAAGAAPRPDLDLDGPCLVIVKGLEEGTRFDLAPGLRRTRTWIIGRRRGVEVSLDYDPFVSAEHALVAWDGASYAVRDLPGSLNGTELNFRRLAKDLTRPLRTGDLLGVGRSILMFRR